MGQGREREGAKDGRGMDARLGSCAEPPWRRRSAPVLDAAHELPAAAPATPRVPVREGIVAKVRQAAREVPAGTKKEIVGCWSALADASGH